MPMRRSPKKKPAYVVIIRAIHARGQDQLDAIEELAQRGLWLHDGKGGGDNQVAQGDLRKIDHHPWYEQKETVR